MGLVAGSRSGVLLSAFSVPFNHGLMSDLMYYAVFITFDVLDAVFIIHLKSVNKFGN